MATKAKKLPQYIAACCICIGAMGAGTVLGWSANITEKLKDGELNDFKMDDDQLGWAGSTMTLGGMVMCFPVGFMANGIGRKMTVLLTVIPFLVGWFLITFAQHIAMIYTGRILTGVACGSFCVVAPLYNSEIAETEIRGRLGTFFQLFITIGILYAYVMGYPLPLMYYHFSVIAIPVIFGIVFFFQPESPVYLTQKGKTEKAQKSMERLRGKDHDASAELKVIEERIAKEKERASFLVAIKAKSAKKAMLICFMLMFYQQLSGINAVIFYMNAIFTAAGSSLAPHWCTIIIGVIQVIATVFSSLVIEKLGRKILLMASCGLMSFSCFLIGMFFSFKNHKVLDEYGIKDMAFIPILALILFIIGFSIGLGPIPWLASSEISPPEIMAILGAGAATFNWILAFLVTRFYLKLADAIGNDITFYIFAVVSLSGIFFVLFLIPETKGKTFDQIQAELEGKPAAQ